MSTRHQVTTFTCTMLVIANMIGTGVFTSLGYQLYGMQNPFALLMLWVLGAILAYCGAVAYLALSRAMPVSGGEYVFLGKLYHPIFGYYAALVSFIYGFAAPVAINALLIAAFSHHLGWIGGKTVAVGLILLITLLHSQSNRIGS